MSRWFCLFFLILFAVCGTLSGQDFYLICRINEMQKVPGISTAENLFLPAVIRNMEIQLKERNLKLPLQSFSVAGQDGNIFLCVNGLTADQFRYLLKYKILDLDYTESQGKDGLILFDLPDCTARFRPDGKRMELVPSSMKNRTDLVLLSDAVGVTFGVIDGKLNIDKKNNKLPFLADVDTICFCVKDNTDFLTADIRLEGNNPEKIFAETEAYFKMILTAAAKVGEVTPAHKEAFKVEYMTHEDSSGRMHKTPVIRVKLTPEMADVFFTVLHKLTTTRSANL